MNRYIQLAFLSLSLIFISCSNDNKHVEDGPAEKKTPAIQAVISAKHVRVPNSNFYIIPPKGYSIDQLSQLLTKEDASRYAANFVPMTIFAGTTIEEYINGVRAISDSKYRGVWEEEKVDVGGVPATMCRYQALDGVKMYHLFFADKWKGQSLIANYDEREPATGEEMKTALQTLIIK